MSDPKKKSDTGKTKTGKFQLNKETLKDLSGNKLANVKGGARRCTEANTGCNGAV